MNIHLLEQVVKLIFLLVRWDSGQNQFSGNDQDHIEETRSRPCRKSGPNWAISARGKTKGNIIKLILGEYVKPVAIQFLAYFCTNHNTSLEWSTLHEWFLEVCATNIGNTIKSLRKLLGRSFQCIKFWFALLYFSLNIILENNENWNLLRWGMGRKFPKRSYSRCTLSSDTGIRAKQVCLIKDIMSELTCYEKRVIYILGISKFRFKLVENNAQGLYFAPLINV